MLRPRQIAERLGVPYERVRCLIAAGALPAVNLSPRNRRPSWWVEESDLFHFLKLRRSGAGVSPTASAEVKASLPASWGSPAPRTSGASGASGAAPGEPVVRGGRGVDAGVGGDQLVQTASVRPMRARRSKPQRVPSDEALAFMRKVMSCERVA